jgi:hypothetical protein
VVQILQERRQRLVMTIEDPMAGDYSETNYIVPFILLLSVLLLEAVVFCLLDNFDNCIAIFNIRSYEVIS